MLEYIRVDWLCSNNSQSNASIRTDRHCAICRPEPPASLQAPGAIIF